MSPTEKLRFEAENPRRQVITKTDLAKIENSWLQLPHEVSKGAQKNFDVYSKFVVTEWQHRPLQFNDECFKCVVAHAIVFRELERLVPTQTDWYDGGYRANIVTFTIAKLAHVIAERGAGGALNIQSIWRTQAISEALSSQLKVIAREMYTVITSPEQGLQNVTEWCKKELAWQRAQQQQVRLLPEFAAELVSQNEEQKRRTDAIDTARIDVGIVAITQVMTYKPTSWRKMRDWGLQRNELTSKGGSTVVARCHCWKGA